MALPSSGQISLLEIGLEFSDTSPYSMSEYVGEVGKTATAGQNVAFSDFYGLSAGYTATLTVAYYYNLSYGANNYGFLAQHCHAANIPPSDYGSISVGTYNGETIRGIYRAQLSFDADVAVRFVNGALAQNFFTSITVDGGSPYLTTNATYSQDSQGTLWEWGDGTSSPIGGAGAEHTIDIA